MSRLTNALVSGVVLALGRGRRRPSKDAHRIVPKLPPNPTAEAVAIFFLFFAAICAVAFIVIYALDFLPARTQLWGTCLGLCFLSIATTFIIIAKKLITTEELVEPYTPELHPHESELIADVVEQSGDRFTRKRLFKAGAAAAGGTLGLALLTPAVSFGPIFEVHPFRTTQWKRGLRLVDEDDVPYKASDIEEDDFYTAFPEGTNVEEKEHLGAAVIVVRVPPDSLDLPRSLARYPTDRIVAYSKICTHAGCAISMYRAPLFQPDEPRPALVCPCHYSTFDPSNGGKVMFGPAGRKLPMLPLFTDRDGYLRANGNFDEQIGPSWWGVRMWGPKHS